MEIFTKENRMTEVIRTNYYLLPVINRFGIGLGLKDKTIQEICKEKNINTDFFLIVINTYHNEEYFPQKEFMSFSPILIVDYLKKTHNYYLNYVLPRIEKILEQFISNCSDKCKDMIMIDSFYKKYKEEFLLHIREEEEIVFPYIINLVNKTPDSTKNYSVHVFEKEHTNIDIKLNDLKNLIIKYIEPVYDNNLCNEFLITLYHFEKDVIDHARIEDKILIPQVLSLEDNTGS